MSITSVLDSFRLRNRSVWTDPHKGAFIYIERKWTRTFLAFKTRWYPWGIQRLVSTYSNHHRRGGVLESQKPKCQDLPKFQFSEGGGVLNQIPQQGVLRILSRNFALPLSGCLCITDSLSHTTYVETNELLEISVLFFLNGGEHQRKRTNLRE